MGGFFDFLQEFARQHPDQGPLVIVAGMSVIIVWIVVRNQRH
jgi:hypothetical protein